MLDEKSCAVYPARRCHNDSNGKAKKQNKNGKDAPDGDFNTWGFLSHSAQYTGRIRPYPRTLWLEVFKWEARQCLAARN
jgi:hypothetical protein